MNISIDVENISGKSHCQFVIQTVSKLGMAGDVVSLNKDIYKKSTSNIRLPIEKLNSFPSEPGKKSRMSIFTILFNILLEVLVNEIK